MYKLLATLALVALLVGGCSNFGIWVSKKVYPALHPPEDKEPPPTFRMDSPSTQLSALVGGQGGGISCSIPAVLKPLFFRAHGNLGDVNLRFRQACAMHDLCYRHGEATYGYTQADCDFALLEGAFRICAIAFTDRAAEDSNNRRVLAVRYRMTPAVRADMASIGATDVDRMQLAPLINETCPDQARLVLLGVRAGGGSSFKTSASSSYFDYDPVPVKANDYTVLRWHSDRQRPHVRDGRFYYFHHLHGRTSTTSLPNTKEGIKVYELPQEYIPTPATVIRGTTGDAFFINARTRASNTWLATYRLAVPGTGTGTVVQLQGTLDPDSPMTWVPSPDGPQRQSYWQRYDASVRTCQIAPYKGCIDPRRSQALAVVTDTYRTLQHPPLRGRFLGDGCEYYAIPRRGGRTLVAGQPPDEGAGFKEHLGFLLAPVDPQGAGCRQGAGVVREVPEALEPLGVFATPQQRDLLVGFSADDPGDPASAMHARLLSLAADDQAQRLQFLDPGQQQPLDSGWLRRPVAIVRPGVVDGDDTQIVMTRVEPEDRTRKGKQTPRPSSSPQSFWVHVLAFAYADRQCDVGRCTLRSARGASCRVAGTYDDYVRTASGLTLPGHFDGIGDTTTRPLQIAVLPKGKSTHAFTTTLVPHTGITSIATLRLADLLPSGIVTCQAYRRSGAPSPSG